VCSQIVCNFFARSNIFHTRYLVTESRGTIGQDGLISEFHVNFGSGWVGSSILDPRATLSDNPWIRERERYFSRLSKIFFQAKFMER